MDLELADIEIRVLGCLIEKQLTTPEYYPLTLNSLTNACNQKSNRNPVMSLSESEVNGALNSLRGKHLVWHLSSTGGRVTKYEHNLTQFEFTPQETAVICILFLRGPQTVGEIRGRTGRMHEFKDLVEVQMTLDGLATREEGPLVVELPRQAGTKECRVMHLFGGELDIDAMAEVAAGSSKENAAPVPVKSGKVEELTERVESLEGKLAELEKQFDQFKQQFE